MKWKPGGIACVLVHVQCAVIAASKGDINLRPQRDVVIAHSATRSPAAARGEGAEEMYTPARVSVSPVR